jgi:hypothetical protein
MIRSSTSWGESTISPRVLGLDERRVFWGKEATHIYETVGSRSLPFLLMSYNGRLPSGDLMNMCESFGPPRCVCVRFVSVEGARGRASPTLSLSHLGATQLTGFPQQSLAADQPARWCRVSVAPLFPLFFYCGTWKCDIFPFVVDVVIQSKLASLSSPHGLAVSPASIKTTSISVSVQSAHLRLPVSAGSHQHAIGFSDE